MRAPLSELPQALRAVGLDLTHWLPLWLCAGCSAASVAPSEPAAARRADAPIVAAAPGAWFDAQGGLTVVGAGRRLRLVLSAPIVACEPALSEGGQPAELASRAALPFHLLSDACRPEHPSILLAEESETASPAELERTYNEVARCAAADLGATSGWTPAVIAAGDPCAGALGLGWRLPLAAELVGLTIDDRKAVAGALFEADARAGFGSLLLYARAADGQLTLVTLSPNSSEQAPVLDEALSSRPFSGAALRCVPPTTVARTRAPSPPLPHAQKCLESLRRNQSALRVAPAAPAPPELQKLKAWVERMERSPAMVDDENELRALSQLLAAPVLEGLARDARQERALTEHYAQLAETLDDPSVSAGERARRRAEFDNLRRRLGDQLLQGAVSSGSERTQLSALLAHLERVLRAPPPAEPPKHSGKARQRSHPALLQRLRELRGEKAAQP